MGAFGDPGHAFPAMALCVELARRGHDVTFETWSRWRTHVESEGIRFAAAPEYKVFPQRGDRALRPYEAAAEAALTTRELIADIRPDAVVADILTLAPVLAAQMERVPWATLIPHVFPMPNRTVPPYGFGTLPPKTPAGRILMSATRRLEAIGLDRGRRDLDAARAALGLPPTTGIYGGMSRELTMVATLPHLEYPRAWPTYAHVTGPLHWSPRTKPAHPVPDGSAPLIVVAPSTSQDPTGKLVRAAGKALAGHDVRVVAVTPKAVPDLPHAENIAYVDWIPYDDLMPQASVVICHGGHGTLSLALCAGTPVLAAPAAGDMYENAARLVWSGAGARLLKIVARPSTVRAAVDHLRSNERFARRADAIRIWARSNDGTARAADLVEAFSSTGQ